MKIKESELKEIIANLMKIVEEGDFYNYGIRFEDKERQVGDIIEDFSRHGGDECDSRDFPKFGTDSYNDMQVFDGVSAWDINDWEYVLLSKYSDMFVCDTKHCYLLGCDDLANQDDGLDYGEIVMVDAEVLAVIV